MTIARTFHVASGPDDALCSTHQQTIDLQDDSALQSLKDHIASVELERLTVRVVDPQTRPDSVATSGHGSVVISSTSGTGVTSRLGTYAQVAIALDSTQEIPFDDAAASVLADLVLTPPNTFDVIAEGCQDALPAYYDLEVAMTLLVGLKL